MCDYMNNCTDSDHGTCGDNGECVCKELHKGADCAYTALSPAHYQYPDIKVNTEGKYWFYASQNKSSDNNWRVILQSSNA